MSLLSGGLVFFGLSYAGFLFQVARNHNSAPGTYHIAYFTRPYLLWKVRNPQRMICEKPPNTQGLKGRIMPSRTLLLT
jgi:hypothetical protein